MRHIALDLLLLIGIANILIGFYVFTRDVRNRLLQIYLGLSLSIAMWAISLFLLYTFIDFGIQIEKMTFVAATLMVTFFFYFAVISTQASLGRPVTMSVNIAAVFMIFFALIGEITKSITFESETVYVPTRGFAYPFFAIFFFVTSTTAVILIWKRVGALAKRARRDQLFLAVGCTLTVFGGMLFNLFIPLIFSTSRYGVYGPLWVSAFLSVSVYHIFTGKYLDIRYAVNRATVHLLLSIVAISSYSLVVILIRNQLTSIFGLEPIHYLSYPSQQ